MVEERGVRTVMESNGRKCGRAGDSGGCSEYWRSPVQHLWVQTAIEGGHVPMLHGEREQEIYFRVPTFLGGDNPATMG